VTRLWPKGTLITVVSASEDQRPERFKWAGREHQVVEITKLWRVDIDWWRLHIWRAYFKLRTNTGLLLVIFQDLLSGEWYLQRLFD
jgi:hypothetical protein